MIKKLALLLLLSGICLSSQAQIYAEDYNLNNTHNITRGGIGMVYSVMAGVTMPRLTDKADELDITNPAGYQIGFSGGISFGGLEILPEIWYQHDKSKIGNMPISHNTSGKGTTSYDEDSGTMTSNSIEVPIIFAMKLGPVRFNVGPSFSLLNSCKSRFDDEDFTYDFGRTRSTVGYVAGVSTVLYQHFIVDFRYTGRFVSVSNYSTDYEEHDYRFYSLSFNVGYRF